MKWNKLNVKSIFLAFKLLAHFIYIWHMINQYIAYQLRLFDFKHKLSIRGKSYNVSIFAVPYLFAVLRLMKLSRYSKSFIPS